MKTDNEITCVVPETLVKEIMKECSKKHIKELASIVGRGNGKSQTDLAKHVINSDLPESEKRKMLDAMGFELRKKDGQKR